MSQQFYKTELERELLIAKIKKHPSLYEVFRKKKDLTPQTNEDIQIRINGEIENFVTIFVTGNQGCHLKGTKITTKNGLQNIEDIKDGENVWAQNKWKKCKLITKGVQKILKITLRNHQELYMTPDHVMKTNRGWIQAKNLRKTDSLIIGNMKWKSTWNKKSEKASLIAMILADGHLFYQKTKTKYKYKRITKRKLKKQPSLYHNRIIKKVKFFNSDSSLREYFQKTLMKIGVANKKYCEYRDKHTKSTKVVTIANHKIFDYFKSKGVPNGKKSTIVKIPNWVLKSDAAMNGFLAGYFACDGSFYKNTIEISSCSKEMINQLMIWLQSKGIVCRIYIRKNKSPVNDNYKLHIMNTESLILWKKNVPCISDTKKINLVNLQYKKTRLSSSGTQLNVIKKEQYGKGEVYDLQVNDIHQYLAN
jgi:intein/homing endonuclease